MSAQAFCVYSRRPSPLSLLGLFLHCGGVWSLRPEEGTDEYYYYIMDPDTVALAAINTLAEARTWSATDDISGDSLMAALGGPTLIRELTLIPRDLWTNTVNALQIQTAADPPGSPSCPHPY